MRLDDIKAELRHKPTKQLEQIQEFIRIVIELRNVEMVPKDGI